MVARAPVRAQRPLIRLAISPVSRSRAAEPVARRARASPVQADPCCPPPGDLPPGLLWHGKPCSNLEDLNLIFTDGSRVLAAYCLIGLEIGIVLRNVTEKYLVTIPKLSHVENFVFIVAICFQFFFI